MSLDHMSSTVKEISGEAESAIGDAVGDRGAQVGGRLRAAEGRAETIFADTRDAVRDTAGDVSGYAGQSYERGVRSLRDGGQTVAQQVAEKPLAALLVAGLVGFGLGLLIHRT